MISSPTAVPAGGGKSTSAGTKRAPLVKLKYRPPLPWEQSGAVASPSEFGSVTEYVFKALNRRFLDYYDVLLGLITTLEVLFLWLEFFDYYYYFLLRECFVLFDLFFFGFHFHFHFLFLFSFSFFPTLSFLSSPLGR